MAEKVERVYVIPLGKDFRKAPRWRRSKRAVNFVRSFISKHMKSDNVKIEKELSEAIWERGAKNPPVRIKVSTKKEDDEVRVQLFGKEFSKKKEKETKESKAQKKEENKKETEMEKKKKKEEEQTKPTLKSRMKNE